MSIETIKKLVTWNNKNQNKILGIRANIATMQNAIENGLDPFEFINLEDL